MFVCSYNCLLSSCPVSVCSFVRTVVSNLELSVCLYVRTIVSYRAVPCLYVHVFAELSLILSCLYVCMFEQLHVLTTTCSSVTLTLHIKT